MAATFVQVGGVTCNYVFKDKSLNRGQCQVALPDTVTLTEANTFGDYLGTQLEAGSDAQIQGYTITSRYIAQGAAAAVAGGNVEQKANLSFATAAGKSMQFTIPAPKVAIMQANERYLDEANATVVAIVGLFLDGAGGTYVTPVDSNKSDITALLETWVSHRRSRLG
jgi:hypothetical protein